MYRGFSHSANVRAATTDALAGSVGTAAILKLRRIQVHMYALRAMSIVANVTFPPKSAALVAKAQSVV